MEIFYTTGQKFASAKNIAAFSAKLCKGIYLGLITDNNGDSEFKITCWSLDASSALNAMFNTQNLPATWTIGTAVNFEFNSTRLPYIKLAKNLKFYSLPDTFKIAVNVGNIYVSKLSISLRIANAKSDFTGEFAVFHPNNDIELPFHFHQYSILMIIQ